MSTLKRTPLYDSHVAAGARMVDFGGWEMPVSYGSQVEEHHQIRRHAGLFDVSHMGIVDFRGGDQRGFLSRLLANSVTKLKTPGKALYSCMLLDAGGVIDDLIVYYLGDERFRMVINAGTRAKDLAWMRAKVVPFGVEIIERTDLAMIAIQGPKAREIFYAAMPGMEAVASGLKPFFGAAVGELFVARTGYTGEDGFELMLPAKAAQFTWKMLTEAGAKPCGLGARDTLRLEAGMNLYGSDMDEGVSPLESGLAWTVTLDEGRDFIGRAALEAQKAQGVARDLRGLILEDKGVLRSHMAVDCGDLGRGETTSGSFSPTLNLSIALARLPVGMQPGARCTVEIRGRQLAARVVKYPFVRNGAPCHG